MANTKIEWTEKVWNTVTGCSKISTGCKNCYAEKMTKRLQAMGIQEYSQGFSKVVYHSHKLIQPFNWKKPKLIFVNSMSDLFHRKVPNTFIRKIFRIMNKNNQHTYQILTKRPERLLKIQHALNFTDNIWIGVSIENNQNLDRLDILKKIECQKRFISFEPLLEYLFGLDYSDIKDIDWVIVGGESGFNARPIESYWVERIRDLCIYEKVPFFFKQWGGKNKKKTGRLLDGRIWNEMPNFKRLRT